MPITWSYDSHYSIEILAQKPPSWSQNKGIPLVSGAVFVMNDGNHDSFFCRSQRKYSVCRAEITEGDSFYLHFCRSRPPCDTVTTTGAHDLITMVKYKVFNWPLGITSKIDLS